MTNIIAFDSKVKKGSETVGCVGKESDGGAELRYRRINPEDLVDKCVMEEKVC